VTVVLGRGSTQFTVQLRRAAVDTDDVSASMVTANVERLRISAGVDAATLRTVLDVLRA